MGTRTLSFLGVLAAAASARAVTFTNSPLTGDDGIAWSQFGDASTGVGGSVPAGTNGTTDGGRAFIVDTDTRVIGGRLFSPPLPSGGSTFDPISVQFDLATSVAAVGATASPGWSNFGYHVTLEVFDGAGALLGSVTQAYENVPGVFLGAVSDASNIARARYTVATDQPRVTSDFALSPVTLRTEAVPEPASLLVLGLGTLAVRRKHRSL